jgi:hypothetical protein
MEVTRQHPVDLLGRAGPAETAAQAEASRDRPERRSPPTSMTRGSLGNAPLVGSFEIHAAVTHKGEQQP